MCEIYGVNPNSCSCHHIIERSDAKNPNSVFFGYPVDELSNLYPFPMNKGEGFSTEHRRTHQLIEAHEPLPNTLHRKYKKQTIYKAKRTKKRRR